MKSLYRAAVLAALSLSACQQQPAARQETAQAPDQAGPDAKPGVAVEGARLVLPAVKGNPGAAYFMLDNRSGGSVAVSAIAIDGAGKTEIHQTAAESMVPVDRIEVAPGTGVRFEPGKLHVMAFDLDPGLKAGGKTELTVTFAGGDKLSAPLSIEAAGGADHGDEH